MGYIRDLLNEAKAQYRVDPRRIYVLGFSNGAFMTYRLACELPDLIAAIVPIAGATFQNEAACVSTKSISVLHIHGTADASVRFYDHDYDHDQNPATPVIDDRLDTPGAVESLSRFAIKAGCDVSNGLTTRGQINIWHPVARTDPAQPPATIGEGDETTIRTFEGCDPGFNFELWEVAGGTHATYFEGDVSLIRDGILPHARIMSWLMEHSLSP